MEESIQKLYSKVRNVAAIFLIYQYRVNVEQVKKLVPQIQEFVLWFLEGNKFGIEEDVYQGMSNNLLMILEDIVMALEGEDSVLLHDAIAYGLLEYLELFVGEEEEEE